MKMTTKKRRYLVELLTKFKRTPGMYFHKPTYDNLFYFILGYDALCGNAISGRVEELLSDRGAPKNLHWHGSFLYALFPNATDPFKHVRSSKKAEAKAFYGLIDTLLDVLSTESRKINSTRQP